MSSLQSIIEHSLLDLVGVYVYTDEKVGRDAGDLCGTASTGVRATNTIEDILAVRPDCVMYMPLIDHESIDDICRLLEYSRTMYVTKALDPDWKVLDTGWHVQVKGDAPMDLDLRFSPENYGQYSPRINSNLPINSVPAVCQAPPGIVTTADLRIVPYFG